MTPRPGSATADAVVDLEVGAPVTALVVTYASGRHVERLLASIDALTAAGTPIDVLVVDNASTDDGPQRAAAHPRVRLLQLDDNLGYSGAINAGLRLVDPDRPVLVLNPDTTLAAGSLEALLGALDDPGVGVVVPRMVDETGALSPSLRHEPSLLRALVDVLTGKQAARLPRGLSEIVWDARDYDREQDVDWATGAALLIGPRARAAVGEWDDRRFFLYSEETDYCRRTRASGLRVRYVPTAVVSHVGAGSGTSAALEALLAVNKVRYFRKHHGAGAAAFFHAATVLGVLLRIRRPASRVVLGALLRERDRAALPGGATRRGWTP